MSLITIENDTEAINKLRGFLPDRIFDAHIHIYEESFAPNVGYESSKVTVNDYFEFMKPLFENRKIRLNLILHPDSFMKDKSNGALQKSDGFLLRELASNPENIGEIIVLPNETAEELENRLTDRRIKGFKCYHLMSGRIDSFNCTIDEYLPESAWYIADKRRMCITLHMVRDKALADGKNLEYIKNMTARYPNAILILAHAARGFAAWTAIESIDQIANIENVWFDFSAVCESPAMFSIIKKAGVSRCMWGSDFPVCTTRGKAISLADAFYWINENDIKGFSSKATLNSWLVNTENLMAVRQACIMAELTDGQKEDLFYNNAARLFA